MLILLKKVCKDVRVELQLQQVTGYYFSNQLQLVMKSDLIAVLLGSGKQLR